MFMRIQWVRVCSVPCLFLLVDMCRVCLPFSEIALAGGPMSDYKRPRLNGILFREAGVTMFTTQMILGETAPRDLESSQWGPQKQN